MGSTFANTSFDTTNSDTQAVQNSELLGLPSGLVGTTSHSPSSRPRTPYTTTFASSVGSPELLIQQLHAPDVLSTESMNRPGSTSEQYTGFGGPRTPSTDSAAADTLNPSGFVNRSMLNAHVESLHASGYDQMPSMPQDMVSGGMESQKAFGFDSVNNSPGNTYHDSSGLYSHVPMKTYSNDPYVSLRRSDPVMSRHCTEHVKIGNDEPVALLRQFDDTITSDITCIRRCCASR